MVDEVFKIEQPSWRFEEQRLFIVCGFSVANEIFEEKFEFNFPSQLNKINTQALDELTRLLSVATATSYYKAFVAKKVQIDFPVASGTLLWTEQLFDKGLREFKFENDISIDQVPEFESIESKKGAQAAPNVAMVNRCLVPIGGGKDSATTLQILSKCEVDIVGFCVGDFKPIKKTAEVAEIEIISVNRSIDSRLHELNKAGAPNGHIPVTAINSVLAVIAALCIDADCVAMSNESSADEPTRIVDGEEVNHQWSKSFEAEQLLRNALSGSGITINYCSILRGLSEYEIFQLFSAFEKFHEVFTSCNRAFKIDENARSSSWCCDCDKCRFVFLGLCAFRPTSYVQEIFGNDLLDDHTQIRGFRSLLGFENDKPFECVGTLRESRLLAMKTIMSNPDSLFASEFRELLANPWPDLPLASVTRTNENIPISIRSKINEMLKSEYIKSSLEQVQSQSFAVVGLGRDTSAIIRYLNSIGYDKEIEVCLPQNQNLDDVGQKEILQSNGLGDVSTALRFVDNVESLSAEVVFISPGISKYSSEVIYIGQRATTPLAWWLELNKKLLPNTGFIGITGTKGKSTTSSMLAHVLDNSILAGNVGNAVGDIDLSELVAADFIVLEISSYQASYARVSPSIVGVTVLFDCHIDWHRSPQQYRKDKLNIAMHSPEHIVISSDIATNHPELNSNNGSELHVIEFNDLSIKEKNTALVKKIVGLASPRIKGTEIDNRIESFQPLKYRYETVAEIGGVKYISDVLSTAPQAVLASVKDTLRENKGNIYLLFGGAKSDVGHESFIEDINQLNRVVVVALPQTGHEVESGLNNKLHGANLEDGLSIARNRAKAGDVILLAPGAPSFHAYKNYEELAAHFSNLLGV